MEQIEQEEQAPLDGIIEVSHQRERLFYNYNEMLSFLAFSHPSGFQVQGGVIGDKPCWQLIYVNSNGGE